MSSDAAYGWTDRKPSIRRVLFALLKKNILIKVRHPTSIIEFLIGCGIWIVMYPIWKMARADYEGTSISPELAYNPIVPNRLLTFFAWTEHPTLVGVPDNEQVRGLIDGLFANMKQLADSANMTDLIVMEAVEIHYTNSLDTMQDIIYASESNALGIYWVNSAEPTAEISPIYETYLQSFAGAPTNDLFQVLYQSMAGAKMKYRVVFMNHTYQKYASPSTEEIYQIDIAIALFVILPIFFTTMPDFQTILEEKDSRVQTMSFLMGCSEAAYFFVSGMMQTVLSLIVYASMSAGLAYWFCMTGTDFSLLLVLALLFILSHVIFQLFLTTFMKKMSTGRAITVVMAVLTVFFGHLHSWFTLDETNSIEALKHILSLLPISAYQASMMAIYRNCWATLPPIGWSNMAPPTLLYPMRYGIGWLIGDLILYLLLFCLFNLTMPRDFGTPLLKWSELFNKNAWRRLFVDDEFGSKVGCECEQLIRVENVSKTYYGEREVTALTDVQFSINAGEVIVVIGPNGAGKSTMMNILSGALEPSEGTLWIMGGEPTKRFKSIQKYLGVCFQENVLVPLLTITEHFQLFGAFRGIDEAYLKERLEFFADTLQLREMLANRSRDLSGGQKRKLCIAMSLLGNPPIVIMDEPTAGVDVQARQLIWKTISSLTDSTTIVTSHALEEAEAVSSRLFIVAGGKLPFQGTATELREEFKCGYLIRIERDGDDLSDVLAFVKRFLPDAHIAEDRPDAISVPVTKEIPSCLRELEKAKAELGIRSYTVCVEQLEDMLLKLIMTEEAKFEGIVSS
jgi:ABC-type multidrug transport system ATPase subunit